jgi:hypothetical protein
MCPFEDEHEFGRLKPAAVALWHQHQKTAGELEKKECGEVLALLRSLYALEEGIRKGARRRRRTPARAADEVA